MQSKQYFTKIKNYPHEKSTEPKLCSYQAIGSDAIQLRNSLFVKCGISPFFLLLDVIDNHLSFGWP